MNEYLDDVRALIEQIKCGIEAVESRLEETGFDAYEFEGMTRNVKGGVNPYAGLAAIKREIDELLLKCDKIQKQIRAILCAIISPTFGLSEIKAEISAIEAKLDSPTFGLSEIKAEISAIEAKLDSRTFGLSEIKAEVSAIEAKLDSPTFGLSEIKAEVSELLAARGLSQNLTTGPFLKTLTENALHLKALNQTATTQSVTFFVHNLTPCITTFTVVEFLNITSCCADFTEILTDISPLNMEVRAQLSTTFGIFVYAATGILPLLGSLTKVETFHSADWLPLGTVCG